MRVASPKAARFLLPPPRESKSSPGRILGLKEMNLPSLIGLIAKGLPWSTVPPFARVTGFSQQELADFLAFRPARLPAVGFRARLVLLNPSAL